MTTKYLGTLNVDAGEAGTVTLEITTATPLDRIAAVLRFADDMTTAKPVDEAVSEPDPPPVVAKPKAPRAAKVKPPTPESIECDVCGRACAGKRGLAIHRASHGDAPAAKVLALPAADSELGPDALLLRCADCDFVAPPTTHGMGIRRHAEKEHSRPSTAAERTPRTQAAVDAAEATG